MAPYNAMLVQMQKPDSTLLHRRLIGNIALTASRLGARPLIILRPFAGRVCVRAWGRWGTLGSEWDIESVHRQQCNQQRNNWALRNLKKKAYALSSRNMVLFSVDSSHQKSRKQTSN